jgi:hypothetical protein
MYRFFLSIFFTGVLSASVVAQVQPGSVGGTIGKQDKSISGDEENTRVAPPLKRRDATTQPTSSGHPCSAIVGTWSWYRGVTQMTFLQGGTLQSSTGATATWTCTNKRSAQSVGKGSKEQYTVSQDGKSMHVISTWGGGITFTATRLSAGTAQ